MQEWSIYKKRPEEPASSAIVKEPLFGGSTRTLFDALLQLFSRFCDHPSISKSTFSENLAIQLSLLPPDNVLPSCFQVARKAKSPCLHINMNMTHVRRITKMPQILLCVEKAEQIGKEDKESVLFIFHWDCDLHGCLFPVPFGSWSNCSSQKLHRNRNPPLA